MTVQYITCVHHKENWLSSQKQLTMTSSSLTRTTEHITDNVLETIQVWAYISFCKGQWKMSKEDQGSDSVAAMDSYEK